MALVETKFLLQRCLCTRVHTGEVEREFKRVCHKQKLECKRVTSIAFGGKLTATKQPNDKRHFNRVTDCYKQQMMIYSHCLPRIPYVHRQHIHTHRHPLTLLSIQFSVR